MEKMKRMQKITLNTETKNKYLIFTPSESPNNH